MGFLIGYICITVYFSLFTFFVFLKINETKEYLLTPRYLYKYSKLNILSVILLFIFLLIIIPIYYILLLIYWLYHIRKK